MGEGLFGGRPGGGGGGQGQGQQPIGTQMVGSEQYRRGGLGPTGGFGGTHPNDPRNPYSQTGGFIPETQGGPAQGKIPGGGNQQMDIPSGTLSAGNGITSRQTPYTGPGGKRTKRLGQAAAQPTQTGQLIGGLPQ